MKPSSSLSSLHTSVEYFSSIIVLWCGYVVAVLVLIKAKFSCGMVNTGIERSSAGWNFYDLFTLKRRVMKGTVESSSSPCPCSLALFSFHLPHCYCGQCSHSVDDDDGAEWSQPEFDVCVASWPTDHPSSWAQSVEYYYLVHMM